MSTLTFGVGINAQEISPLVNLSTQFDSLCGVLCWWRSLLDATTCQVTGRLENALAFRAVLEYLDTEKIALDTGREGKTNYEASVAPEIAGLGGGGKADWGGSNNWKLSAETRVYLVAAIDLVDKVIKYLCPTDVIGVGDVIDCFLRGAMTSDQARVLMKINGISWESVYPLIYARRERVTAEEFISLARRNGVPDDVTLAELRGYGYISDDDRLNKMLAFDQLPTISDVLHFLQRNVFQEDYVERYGLLDGFEDRFWARYGVALRAQGVTKQTASDHYAAHWINPSVGQLAEMAQRLRPDRAARIADELNADGSTTGEPPRPFLPSDLVFTWNDFDRVLAEQDVAPFFRPRLQAISYRTLPIRQLTSAVKHQGIDQAELAQRWQDIGFSPADSDILARSMWIDAARQQAAQAHGYTPAVVAKLWQGNLITKRESYDHLSPQGYSREEIDTLLEVASREQIAADRNKYEERSLGDYARLAVKAYEDGVVTAENATNALRDAGYTDQAAELEIRTASLRVSMASADATIKAIRKAFLRGEVSVSQAADLLARGGVTPEASRVYVSRWQLELTIPRVHASTQQILRWAQKGILSVDNSAIRLANLGWQPGDIDLMLVELEQTIAQAKAKANAKRVKELAQAQAAAQRAVNETHKGFCRIYTPSKMVKWYAERIIDEPKFRARLDQCGYGPEAVQNLFEEAVLARERTDAKAEKKGAAGVEYTGPGADTSGLPGGPTG